MSNIRVPQKLFHATVTQNMPLRKPGLQGNYLIQIRIDHKVVCQPGHFFKFDLSEHLERKSLAIEAENDLVIVKNPPNSNDFIARQPLISRPYSVGLCEHKQNQTYLTFVYKIFGPGSKKLSELLPGQTIKAMGPLGGGFFYLPKHAKKVLMVAGGVGLPPLLFFIKKLLSKDLESIHLFVGAATSEKLPLHAAFQIGLKAEDCCDWPDVFQHLTDPRVTTQISTDDGSEGQPGLTTDLLEDHLHTTDIRDTIVYTCGPWKMMARTAAVAWQHNLPCQACLEEMMGCGIGACQSCATKIKADNPKGWEYKLVCRDGPVFDAKEIYWEKE